MLIGGGLVFLGFGIMRSGPQAARHPEPRPDATKQVTVDPARYAGYPRVRMVYAMAAEIKPTLDGLYCYCRCSEHAGHRSLLTCFESDHSAGCDVCLGQAALSYWMKNRGASLDEIRRENDRKFGSGSARG
ncbi:MAG: hypothetical protein HY702_06115 [Gemmatimonadetes bacterium]|nr:hypothetical protein [Gemmatimonadota bacterium]